MPFKRCARCGKDFLAKDDSQDLCSASCTPMRGLDELDATQAPDRWWTFPFFFLAACALTAYCYVYAYDVELFLLRNLSFGRDFMAAKLAAGGSESLGHLMQAIRDPDAEEVRLTLVALGEHGAEIPPDEPLRAELAAELVAIWTQEQDGRLRAAALTAMACIPDASLESTLIDALREENFIRPALVALRRIGTQRSVSHVADIVRDDRRVYTVGDLRYQAVITLGHLADDDGRGLLVLADVLNDPSGPLRQEAIKAIERIGLRYPSMTMTGKEQMKACMEVLRRRKGSDRLTMVRDQYARSLVELEKVVR